jgi:hypothetical protein
MGDAAPQIPSQHHEICRYTVFNLHRDVGNINADCSWSTMPKGELKMLALKAGKSAGQMHCFLLALCFVGYLEKTSPFYF